MVDPSTRHRRLRNDGDCQKSSTPCLSGYNDDDINNRPSPWHIAVIVTISFIWLVATCALTWALSCCGPVTPESPVHDGRTVCSEEDEDEGADVGDGDEEEDEESIRTVRKVDSDEECPSTEEFAASDASSTSSSSGGHHHAGTPSTDDDGAPREEVESV